jgi:hypothetical protein
MKAENWFQLGIAGVTSIEARFQPGSVLEAGSSNRGPRSWVTKVDSLCDKHALRSGPGAQGDDSVVGAVAGELSPAKVGADENLT